MNDNIIEINIKSQSSILGYKILKSAADQQECFDISISQTGTESCSEVYFEDISRDEGQAIDIAFLLAKETVTPETAEYIIEELIAGLIRM